MSSQQVELRHTGKYLAGSHIYGRFFPYTSIGIPFQANDSNETVTVDKNADRPIAERCILADGDILVCASWGGIGFGVFRLNDNGTLTTLYENSSHSSNLSNLCLDTVNHIAYTGRYASNGIAVYDYSECFGGNNSVTKKTTMQESNGLTENLHGTSYMNGLEFAGEYVYMCPSVTGHSGYQLRCKVDSAGAFIANDNIPCVGYKTVNGYDGWITYDAVNDRIFTMHEYDGMLYVTINASYAMDHPTTPAKCYCINLNFSGALSTNDMYQGGVGWDPENINHLYVLGYYGRVCKLDISDILTYEDGRNPTALQGRNTAYQYGQWQPMMFGGYNSGMFDPEQPDFIIIKPDRGYCETYGWIDIDNMRLVGAGTVSRESNGEHGEAPKFSESLLYYQYGPAPIRMTSNGGSPTNYWISSGYSGDGYQFRVYLASAVDAGRLWPTGYMRLGSWSLPGSAKIGSVHIVNLTSLAVEPTGTTLLVEVSNNGAASWETYDHTVDELHTFSSSGTSLQVKFSFTSNANNTACPYIQGSSVLHIRFSGLPLSGHSNTEIMGI